MKVVKPGYEIQEPLNELEILKKLEKVGRTCYKSDDKITDSSAIKFVEGIIKHGHEAIIEHYSITVKFTCDRGITHEIVRHRVASYAQESTRYCNYSDDKFSNEINVIDPTGGIYLDSKMKNFSADTIAKILIEWNLAMEDAERHYMNLINLGCTPQIARSVLPTATKAELVVTMNLREWRYFLRLRTALAAHPQLRELLLPLLAEFKQKMPIIFNDINN